MAEAFFVSAAANTVGTLMAEVVQKPLERYLPRLFRNRAGQSTSLRDLEFSKFNDLVASRSYTFALDKIMDALKDNSVNTIGVWGMGGVGKTTLVTDVGHRAKALQLFHRVIKVVVSQAPDIEKIQEKIADFLDLKFQKKTKEGKAEELWLRLEKEDKVLIVLDDMWKELNLNEIGIPFYGNHKGSKIILTTRRKPVCESMASQLIVSLGVMEEDEAWTLFKVKASLYEDRGDEETIKFAKEVAKECKGLPVAIVTLASALKDTKTVKGWEVALQKLQSYRLMEIGNIEEEVEQNAYMCLKTSYEYLRKDTTKRCFLLCALYPEDQLIDPEELVRHAWGLELYRDATSIAEVRFEVLEAIDHLKDSCLLLEDDGEYEAVKERKKALLEELERGRELSYQLRHLATTKSKSQSCMGLGDDESVVVGRLQGDLVSKILDSYVNALSMLRNSTSAGCSGYDDDEVSQQINPRNNNTDSEDLGASINSTTTTTQIKDRTGCYKRRKGAKSWTGDTLALFDHGHPWRKYGHAWKKYGQEQILNTNRPRYIKLHDVVRDVARWIAYNEDNGLVIKARSKQKHEILLHDNYDSEIPMDYFEGMRELKVLSLKASYKWNNSVFSLNALESLPNLRALQLEGFKQIVCISALAKLTKLEILCLRNSRIEESINKLGELKLLKILDIDDCKLLLGFPPNLIRRLVEVEELYLYQSRRIGTIKIDTAILSELRFLPRLAALLLKFPSLQFPQDFLFPRLQRYQIAINREFGSYLGISSRSLIISKGESVLNVISELLCNVEFLDVSDIIEKDIKYLTDTTPGTVPVATILQNLKGVRIEECEHLQVIFQVKKSENHALLLSKLKFLYLVELPNLEYIWKVPTQLISLGSLEVVSLVRCGKLKSAFSFSLAQSLVHLEVLYIEGCDELEQLVEELEGDEHEISPNTNLEKPLCLSNLTILVIRHCESLEYIFPKFMAPQGLPQLQKLLMVHLSRLKQIWRPAMQREEHGIQKLFPSMTNLTLVDCPELIDTTIHSERAHLEGNIQSSKLNFIKTKSLTLERIMGDHHNLIPEVDIEGLNELTVLHLYDSDSVEYLVDTTKEHAPDTAFTNLVKLCLKRMGGLKRLCNGKFPKRFLQDLEKLTVEDCAELEEVFEIDEFFYSGGQNQPHLFKGSPPYFSLQSLKVVYISYCGQLKSLFSSSLIQSLLQLEELKIEGCNELKTIFTELENGDGETKSEVEVSLHPLCLPRLTNLIISGCARLEYALPVTLAQGLPRLEAIEVSECAELKRVFGVEKQQDGVEHCIELPRLTYLELYKLTNLGSLGPENYIVKSPALRKLIVYGCPQLMKCTNQEEVNNHWLHLQKSLTPDVERLTSLGLEGCEDLECLVDKTKENETICAMFANLDEIDLQNMTRLEMLCNGKPPKGFLQNLKKLNVEDCWMLGELFGIEEFLYSRQENQALLLSNLECLELMSVPELKWILKGPTQYVCLRNLKTVSIEKCNKLESLFSFSLIQSLSQLEILHICYCDKLEMVFAELESDDETKSNKLLASAHGFPRLQELQLRGLRNLSSFGPENYSIKASVLEYLEVVDCPRLMNFSIQQDKPLQSKFSGVSNFMSSLETMKLDGLIWVDIWKGPIHVVLTNLTKLEVYKCNNLTYIFSPMLVRNLRQLKSLIISECEKVEQIIVDDDELSSSSAQGHDMEMLIFPLLEELSLSDLPSLTRFSPVGYHLLFPDLNELKIEGCSQMITSFTVDSIPLVHAKTKEPRLDHTSPSKPDIRWRRYEPVYCTSDDDEGLPQYVEEADEISEME